MITVAENETLMQDVGLRPVASLILGTMEVPAESLLAFPVPMFGFPNDQEFALLPATREGLWWLQSTADPATTFLLADPFMVDDTFVIDVGESEKRLLAVARPTDVLALVMVTLPAGLAGGAATANFRAPVILNVANGVGMQVVGRDDAQELRRPIALDIFPVQESGVRMQ